MFRIDINFIIYTIVSSSVIFVLRCDAVEFCGGMENGAF